MLGRFIPKLCEDYKVEKVIIRSRMKAGKFSGSSTSFKMEAVLQMLPNVDVRLLAAKLIKETLRNSEVFIDFSETGLKKFQQPAFETGLAYFEL